MEGSVAQAPLPPKTYTPHYWPKDAMGVVYVWRRPFQFSLDIWIVETSIPDTERLVVTDGSATDQVLSIVPSPLGGGVFKSRNWLVYHDDISKALVLVGNGHDVVSCWSAVVVVKSNSQVSYQTLNGTLKAPRRKGFMQWEIFFSNLATDPIEGHEGVYSLSAGLRALNAEFLDERKTETGHLLPVLEETMRGRNLGGPPLPSVPLASAVRGASIDVLLQAARSGDLEGLRYALNNGAPINTADSEGWTPIYHAVMKDRHLVVKGLLKWGADPNVPDKAGRTPLIQASRFGFVKCVQALLRGHANVNLSNEAGLTPLGMALEWAKQDCVEELLVAGSKSHLILNPERIHQGKVDFVKCNREWEPIGSWGSCELILSMDRLDILFDQPPSEHPSLCSIPVSCLPRPWISKPRNAFGIQDMNANPYLFRVKSKELRVWIDAIDKACWAQKKDSSPIWISRFSSLIPTWIVGVQARAHCRTAAAFLARVFRKHALVHKDIVPIIVSMVLETRAFPQWETLVGTS